MKKDLLLIVILCIAALAANAEDVVTVQNFELRASDSEKTVVTLATEVENYRGFQSDVILPLGITVTGISDAGRGVESENVDINKRYGKAEAIEIEGVAMQKQTVVFAISCNFRTGEGDLLHLTFAADESVSAGTYTGYLKNVILSYSTGTTVPVEESSFIIEVYEGNARVILDENSTVVPEASSDPVDVRVKRTINANSWSTICLPFAMTEAQTKEVFGNDVQLAEFLGADSEFDDADNCTGIQVNFSSVSTIEANTPYIIKVSSAVNEFTLDGVNVTPEEGDACIEFDNGKSGSRRIVYSGFYGTYHAETELNEYTLFLSDGRFWYSNGLTKMRGYRAYFEFLDVLTEVENASVKMFVNIDGEEETGIENVNVNDNLNSTIFDLSGRKLDKKPQKGVYIVNGKKILH